MDNYIVYEHISPDGKCYIGITRRTPNERWCKNGYGYRKNIHFYRAIQKYGWNAFQHNILAENLSHKDACALEIKLIKERNLTDPRFGYNICEGGEGRLGSKQSEETRRKIGRASKEHWNDPKIREHIIQGLVGREVTPETREKIRNSQIGKYVPPEVGRKISESKKGKHPWNYGKKCPPRSDETKAKISAFNKGKTISEEHKRAISKKLKGREITPEWRAEISATSKRRNYEQRNQGNI